MYEDVYKKKKKAFLTMRLRSEKQGPWGWLWKSAVVMYVHDFVYSKISTPAVLSFVSAHCWNLLQTLQNTLSLGHLSARCTTSYTLISPPPMTGRFHASSTYSTSRGWKASPDPIRSVYRTFTPLSERNVTIASGLVKHGPEEERRTSWSRSDSRWLSSSVLK